MPTEKTNKQNRVRLNQNPFIAQSTHDEIFRRKQELGLSLGRVLDKAIEDTTATKKRKK